MNNNTNIHIDGVHRFGDLLLFSLFVIIFFYFLKNIVESIKCKRREANIYDDIESLDSVSVISEDNKSILDYQTNIQDTSMNVNIENCSICLNKLEQKYIITNCNHKYHIICLKRWKATSEEFLCPICREPITNITHIPS